MKSNELRIGNLLESNGRVCIVTSIDSTSDFKLSPEGIFSCEFVEEPKHYLSRSDIENYEPILLTEERLLKFGFYRYNTDIEKKFIIKIGNNLWLCWKNEVLSLESKVLIENLKNIKYVHHLQNLYFVLTGEELTIKEQL